MKSYHCLNLLKYFNNKGLTYKEEIEKGNLSLAKSSLPKKELPESLYYKSIPFKFDLESEYDNIELSNQKIIFQPQKIVGLHVIGVSNNGDFYDDIQLLRNNKVIYSEKLCLSDFVSIAPSFRDQRAKKFKQIHTKSGITPNVEPSMWYDSIPINRPLEIDTIQLADNPFMHIFAITLEVV